MTMRGHVENGALILSGPVELPDGTNVEVELRPVGNAAETGPSWGEVFADLAGSVKDLPADMAENHDHYVHGAPKGVDKQ